MVAIIQDEIELTQLCGRAGNLVWIDLSAAGIQFYYTADIRELGIAILALNRHSVPPSKHWVRDLVLNELEEIQTQWIFETESNWLPDALLFAAIGFILLAFVAWIRSY